MVSGAPASSSQVTTQSDGLSTTITAAASQTSSQSQGSGTAVVASGFVARLHDDLEIVLTCCVRIATQDHGQAPAPNPRNTGAIAGAVVGGIAALLLFLFAIWCIGRHRAKRNTTEKSTIEAPKASESGEVTRVVASPQESNTIGIKGHQITYPADERAPLFAYFREDVPAFAPGSRSPDGVENRTPHYSGSLSDRSLTGKNLPQAPSEATTTGPSSSLGSPLDTPIRGSGMHASQAEILQNLLNSNTPRETIASVVQMMAGAGSSPVVDQHGEAPPRYEGQ